MWLDRRGLGQEVGCLGHSGHGACVLCGQDQVADGLFILAGQDEVPRDLRCSQTTAGTSCVLSTGV